MRGLAAGAIVPYACAPQTAGAAGNVPGAGGAVGNAALSHRSAIKAIKAAPDARAWLTEAGREGEFIFRAGDYAALIAADPAEGLYLKADGIAPTAGAWVRTNPEMLVLPEWFGATGNAKRYSETTGKWEPNDRADNDTLAVRAALQWARRGHTMKLSRWYGIYPSTGGTQVDLTDCRAVADGMILPLQTYVVKASGGGSIIYDGKTYTDGQTFTGKTWQMGLVRNGTATVHERLQVGALLDLRTATADSNYRRYVGIDCAENAGLLLCQPGCAIAVLGSFPNGSMAFNSRIGLNVEALPTLDGSETMGFYLSALTFRGETSATVSGCNIGGVFSECWNMSLPRLNYNGAGIGYVGFVLNNANSTNIGHIFTHFTKVAGFVRFVSPHGARVGDTVVVGFNGVSEFTGVVTNIDNAKQLTCDRWVRSATTRLSAWTASVNGAAAVPVVGGKSTYGIGLLATGSEGLDVYCDFQSGGGYGLLYVTDGQQGNSSLSLRGHIEGPSNPVRVTRSASLAGTEALSSFRCDLSMISGRGGNGSDFGEYCGVDLDHVASGIVGTGEYHSREYIVAAGHAVLWAPTTTYARNDVVLLPWGVYQCTRAGTSVVAQARGPIGAGSGIVDGTAVWEFIRYPGHTVRVRDTCQNIKFEPAVHNTNADYALPLDLQNPQDRPVQDYHFLADAAAIKLISLVGSRGTGVITARLPAKIPTLPNERRPIATCKLRIRFDCSDTAGRGRREASTGDAQWCGFRFMTAEQAVSNNVITRITSVEAAQSGGMIDRYVEVPVSQYRDIQYQWQTAGAGWNVKAEVYLIGMGY